jgi:hypothetical protein
LLLDPRSCDVYKYKSRDQNTPTSFTRLRYAPYSSAKNNLFSLFGLGSL